MIIVHFFQILISMNNIKYIYLCIFKYRYFYFYKITLYFLNLYKDHIIHFSYKNFNYNLLLNALYCLKDNICIIIFSYKRKFII